MSETILLHVDDGGNATVTLNRPAVHNAFDPDMVAALIAMLERLSADSRVRAVVLRGTGKNFCAGADIEHMKQSASYSPQQNFEVARQSARMFHALYTLDKPTVACVQGAVRGGGCGLVAACDIAIASHDATFRLSEVKIGVIPAMISPYVIAAIGERMAHRYMLTGEAFDAVEACRIGLVHEAVEPDALEASVEGVLAELHSGGPHAVSAIKKLIPVSAHAEIGPEIVDETARRIAGIRATPEAQEGLSAFLEKRKPSWVTREARSQPGGSRQGAKND
ncbi:MAG TPA: enoyl-CoA hydratase/isomerase family protein [Burkholderiales bacterium]|nr:enoyl-CoA hydratase/isomerase family protein [Burkholderiales bacterium]